VLAVEFLALRFVSRVDPAPRPTWREHARAWLRETVMALRVFCWRQPFRWREIPDRLETAPSLPVRRGVVFIQGFVCNRGFWTPWMEELCARGHPFVAVNLEPVFGSIDQYVPIVEDAVQRITRATGMAPVLVCHSMGGLAARAWLHTTSADAHVHHVITIGSPHHGTWLARFSRLKNGRQMRQQSEWLRQLEQGVGERRHTNFTCWYSNCDNIAFPASTATLSGADNRLVRGAAHVDLGFHPQVMAESLARIAAA
jgi:pimeloyl-ACP methyl ester carboxylesterase